MDSRPVPTAGQVVHLGSKASPQFASHPFDMELTEDAGPSALDAAVGHSIATAGWYRLRGWVLDDAGQRTVERVVSARAGGIVITTDVQP